MPEDRLLLKEINENVLFKSVLFRGGVTPNSRTVAGWVDAAGLRMIKVSLSRLIYLVRFNWIVLVYQIQSFSIFLIPSCPLFSYFAVTFSMCFYLGKLLLKPVYFDLRWFYTPSLTKVTPFRLSLRPIFKISGRHRFFVLPQAAGLRKPEWYFIDLKSTLKAITANN